MAQVGIQVLSSLIFFSSQKELSEEGWTERSDWRSVLQGPPGPEAELKPACPHL